ncbi:MAG: ATP-binding cassette domain-containing protein [Firmicutes bacterium]|nr:ATP-binding cassette domain-containing protein [Bacillota bacterium]
MLEVKNLRKKYGDHTALKGISFYAQKGEVLGLLGPNGAGKSTTMNIITGYLPDFEGEVILNGAAQSDPLYKKNLGYLPEMTPLHKNMTVNEFLEFSADLKSIKKQDKKADIEKALSSTGLLSVRGRRIANLSKGYKQRVGIAQALIGSPEVIILDEPTVGLDPRQMSDIRQLIKGLAKEHTVIFSSHILSEVSAVCDRVVILYKGELLVHDKPQNLADVLGHTAEIYLRVSGDPSKAEAVLSKTEGVSEYRVNDDNSYSVFSDKEDLCESLFFAFAAENLPIVELTPKKSSLEDIFIHYINNAEEKNEGSV